VYFDNVVFSEQGPGLPTPMVPAPDPTIDEEFVASVYSDFYTVNAIPGFNFNAFQGAGDVSEIQIEGNNTGRVEGLTFYGAEWDAFDVSEFLDLTESLFVHLDYWTPNSPGFSFFPIDPTSGIVPGSPEEPRYTFGPNGDEPIVLEEWESVVIPITHFIEFPSGGVEFDIESITQYKFEGSGTIYFDNIFFSVQETVSTTNLEADGISAVPNPSKDAWTLRSENAPITSVHVYNAIGQLVISDAPIAPLTTIDASELKPGLYITRIETANGISVLKLVKN
jgi:hypothetical protein